MLNLKKSAILAGLGLALATSAFAAPNSLYVRADVGYATNGTFKDATTNNVEAKKGKLTYGAGIGYQFDNNLRADVTFQRTNLLSFAVKNVTPSATVKVVDAKGNLHSNLILANIYYDFADMNDSIVPYVTAGVGIGSLGGNVVAATEVNGVTTYAKKSDTSNSRFAYALGLGVSSKISDQVALDVGYKFSQIRGKKDEVNLNNNQFLVGVRFSF